MNDARIAEIATVLTEIVTENQDSKVGVLQEQLELAQRQIQMLQLEDEGWRLLSGLDNHKDEGADLAQLKSMADLLRPAVAGSPLPKQANILRASYMFGEPFVIPGLELAESSSPQKKVGAPTGKDKANRDLRKFVESRPAREYIFGKSAAELIATALSTDSVYLLLGNDTTKAVHAVSLAEITRVMEDPDFPGEIWAYKREWTTVVKGKSETRARWYFTDRYEGTRPDYLGETPDRVEVEKNFTMFDLAVNKQAGWTFGIPDLWAGHVWNRNYLAALKDGLAVTELMSWLTAKVKTQSKAGSDATGVKIGGTGSGAGVQTYGAGNSIDTYTTTGKAYDFDALRPVAAIYALAAGVSVVDLLASPSAAGASYGSAQALAPSMRRAIAMRRDVIASWMERIVEWSCGQFFQVTPASIEEVDLYRKGQMLVMALNTGLFHQDEIRPALARINGIALKHESAPAGYMDPNNTDSLPRKDVDQDGSGSSTAPQAASGNQGVSDGTGGQSSTQRNDTRTDTIA